jgi:outer membrane protein OmpA-like peptidoglycan-associated protein
MKQMSPVNAKVAALDSRANEQAQREQADISKMDEKLSATDARVKEVADSAHEAGTAAKQAGELAQRNQIEIQSDRGVIASNAASIATLGRAMNYTLVAQSEVEFAFDKSALTGTEKDKLATLLQQLQSRKRIEFELVGFTDPVGSPAYNLSLSRKRADSVARYLVEQGAMVRGIHIMGFGKEQAPGAFAEPSTGSASDQDARQRARRVAIRVYAPDANVESAGLRD